VSFQSSSSSSAIRLLPNFQFSILTLLVVFFSLTSPAADLPPTAIITNSKTALGESPLPVGRVEGRTTDSSSFDSANNLYYAGKFTDAVAAYENILYSGQKSVALYYNLGNAWFKSGQIGKAIAAYLQAEKISPRDPDIRANLQFARNQIQGPTLAPARAQRLLGKLTLNEWTLLATAAFWLCFLFLALGEWRPALKRPLRLYLAAAAITTLLLGAWVAVSWVDTRSTKTAIVTSRDVPVRRGPLDESATAFTVHDGAELRVLDQNNDWLQVTSDPSRIGWVRRDQVLLSPQT
jgi:tetratricopeptide (TPR) repeat protein